MAKSKVTGTDREVRIAQRSEAGERRRGVTVGREEKSLLTKENEKLDRGGRTGAARVTRVSDTTPRPKPTRASTAPAKKRATGVKKSSRTSTPKRARAATAKPSSGKAKVRARRARG